MTGNTTATDSKRCPCPDHEGPNPVPVTGFRKRSDKPDRLQSWCNACTERRAARWRADNPGKARQLRRNWRESVRNAVFDHYGRVCSCPGCGAAEDLVIDHVNGDGAQHRIELFGRRDESGPMLYRWLIENDFPDGFQTLCRPCNASKGDGPACRIGH